MLLREERTLAQRVRLALWFTALFAPGEIMRILAPEYSALDLALEGSLLAGLMGGYVSGMLAGILLSIPAAIHNEYLALPFYAAVGLGGGLLRDSASNPMTSGASPHSRREPLSHLRARPRTPQRPFHAYFSGSVVAIELLSSSSAANSAAATCSSPPPPGATRPSYFSPPGSPTTSASPFRSRSGTAPAMRYVSKNRRACSLPRVLKCCPARSNPHFLFNTLNSIASLIRINPSAPRTMVVQLSRIHAPPLRSQGHFSPLRDELDFIDDYLAIELERFGDKLRVLREIDPASADVPVPSMLLQPLVENSIKHGISNKVDGGTIILRARRSGDRLMIEVEDDGVGISQAPQTASEGKGIGVSNVRERLQVLYDDDYKMVIESQPGCGTRILIEIPVHAAAAIRELPDALN